jgi:hypothetical protein
LCNPAHREIRYSNISNREKKREEKMSGTFSKTVIVRSESDGAISCNTRGLLLPWAFLRKAKNAYLAMTMNSK